MLLETYTTQTLEEFKSKLPEFLDIAMTNDVTGDPTHSMYNLSLKEDWKVEEGKEWLNNKKFCFKLAGN